MLSGYFRHRPGFGGIVRCSFVIRRIGVKHQPQLVFINFRFTAAFCISRAGASGPNLSPSVALPPRSSTCRFGLFQRVNPRHHRAAVKPHSLKKRDQHPAVHQSPFRHGYCQPQVHRRVTVQTYPVKCRSPFKRLHQLPGAGRCAPS